VKTFLASKETADRKWVLMDAAGVPLGRLAAAAVSVLKGKHRPTYTPHADAGDFVLVVNASKVVLTGRKAETKRYIHHTGYIGHQYDESFAQLLARHPERVVEFAVRRMMPKTPLGRQLFRKLKVYAGADHPHEAQNPAPWTRGYTKGTGKAERKTT
jgi:large subunit ribosomal protein L13